MAVLNCFVLCSFSNVSISLIFINSIKPRSEIFIETFSKAEILLLYSASQVRVHDSFFEGRMFILTFIQNLIRPFTV